MINTDVDRQLKKKTKECNVMSYFKERHVIIISVRIHAKKMTDAFPPYVQSRQSISIINKTDNLSKYLIQRVEDRPPPKKKYKTRVCS